MPALSFFFLFLLLFSTPEFSSTTSIPRRALHLPLFPEDSPPPAQPPPAPEPFFPFYASPPPPSAPSNPASASSLPANISSLIFPNSHSAPPRRHAAAKIVPAVALPLFALAVLAFSLAFFLHGRRRSRPRRRSDDMVAPSDNIRLFPPGPAASDSRKPPAATSDFLYLGTLIASRSADADENPSPATAAAKRLSLRKARLAGAPPTAPLVSPCSPRVRECRCRGLHGGGVLLSERVFWREGEFRGVRQRPDVNLPRDLPSRRCRDGEMWVPELDAEHPVVPVVQFGVFSESVVARGFVAAARVEPRAIQLQISEIQVRNC